ncbi:hypothetical protein [uncultured Algoriphagus sp.]|uniref:hypothetical protein n=1 Tax=uncultured Algoriphagus sp. TaxID=417365 RepID=UPI0030EDB005|tara:strand:+ start:1829 stop:2053 length:225 start_codon:yes stop_codon:yes gene_type:complete
MKICIAQTKSEKGNIHGNIEKHLGFIERAIKLKADMSAIGMVTFPPAESCPACIIVVCNLVLPSFGSIQRICLV